jgi:hypothetical protein
MAKLQTFKDISEATIKWSNKHISLLKGLGALAFGISLVYLSHKLILNLIVFSAGLLLIYYGLIELRLKKITDIIDKIVAKFKK